MNQNQIRACYEVAIALFNKKMETNYSIDNPRLFFVTEENESSTLKEIERLIGRDASTIEYTSGRKRFMEASVAEAFVGDNVNAIAVNYDFVKNEASGEVVYDFSHELGHVYCLHRELDGIYFIDQYYKDDPDLAHVKSGYEIWKEFVADYIAMSVCDIKICSVMERPSGFQDLANMVQPVDPDYYRNLSWYLVNVICSPEAHLGWKQLKKVMGDSRLPYVDLTGLIFMHLQKSDYWIISEDFLWNIGKINVDDAVKAALAAA